MQAAANLERVTPVTTTPAASVALITYNEERYVRDAIGSVLRQSLRDLELVVFDNGSTDDTPRVVAAFDDPRVAVVRVEENQGASVALNRAIAHCRGRRIALLAGDDVCHPDRLAVQAEALEASGGAVVFSDVDHIDDAGRPIEHGHFPTGLFRVTPQTRAQRLEALFLRGNFIHPMTCFAAAETLRAVGPFDPALSQLNDYEWLVRLTKRFDVAVMPRPTLSVRTRAGNANLSAPEPRRMVRSDNELYLVLRHFFDDTPPELFREAFGARFRRPDSRTSTELACEQAFLYLASPLGPLVRLIGLERLHALLRDPDAAAVLWDRFGFMPTAFADALLDADTLGRLPYFESRLYADTGGGYAGVEYYRQLGNHHCETFEVTFDLAGLPTVRELRWDPVELHLCRVRLDAVTWWDQGGVAHDVPPAEVRTNGHPAADGWTEFRTLDPMYFLPVAGDVRRVTVRGRWQVTDRHSSAALTSARLSEAEGTLRRYEAGVDQ